MNGWMGISNFFMMNPKSPAPIMIKMSKGTLEME